LPRTQAEKLNHFMAQIDTQHLFDLARDKSVAGRQALTATVTDLFFASENVLTDRERALMTEILRQLIHDVEGSVRRALAERLSREKDAPHDLVLALAQDQIDVAQQILLNSTVLCDEELIEIILHRTLEHQLAIAMRNMVSEPVSDALVQSENQDVIRTLLQNHGARISAKTMDYLVEQSKRIDTYQNPLLCRPELGVDLARRMYWWVSAALRQHILANFPVEPGDFDAVLESSVVELMERTVIAEERKSAELAETLVEQEVVTSGLLIQALRQGEIALFEAMFSRLTGIRLTLIRRLLFERGGQGLAIACRGLGMAPPVFNSIFLLSRKARPNEPPPSRSEVREIMELYQSIALPAAVELLKSWQRDHNFLQAVWRVEQPGRARVAG
jgi:uncharacterized protein (DUF2336 family)